MNYSDFMSAPKSPSGNFRLMPGITYRVAATFSGFGGIGVADAAMRIGWSHITLAYSGFGSGYKGELPPYELGFFDPGERYVVFEGTWNGLVAEANGFVVTDSYGKVEAVKYERVYSQLTPDWRTRLGYQAPGTPPVPEPSPAPAPTKPSTPLPMPIATPTTSAAPSWRGPVLLLGVVAGLIAAGVYLERKRLRPTLL